MKAIRWVAPALGLCIFGAPLVLCGLMVFILPSPPPVEMAYPPVVSTLFSLLARPEGEWYYFMDVAAFIASGLLLWLALRGRPLH